MPMPMPMPMPSETEGAAAALRLPPPPPNRNVVVCRRARSSRRNKCPRSFQATVVSAKKPNSHWSPAQALQKHSHSTPDVSATKNSDTDSSVSMSIAEDESLRPQGKRKRKTKIHFDELIYSEKPVKRVRRIRIMRQLGLIAPVGSPFSLSRVRSDAL